MNIGTAVLLVASAFFLLALTAFVYVLYRFLALALSTDIELLKAMRTVRPTSFVMPGTSVGDQLRATVAGTPQAATEGDFQFNSDEELYLAEQVRNLRAQTGALSPEDEEELRKIVRQREQAESTG